MWPILNMPAEDRATDIGIMHRNLVKIARVIPETDRQTDALITILCSGKVKIQYMVQSDK